VLEGAGRSGTHSIGKERIQMRNVRAPKARELLEGEEKEEGEKRRWKKVLLEREFREEKAGKKADS